MSGVAMVLAGLSLLVALTGTAVAATGGNFILGKSNSAGAITRLTNTGSGAALGLATHSLTTPVLALGKNHTRIPNLNADMVDGVHAAALQRRVTGTCSGATAIKSIAASGAVTCTQGPMFAVVNSDGTLARGSSGVSVTHTGGSQIYIVAFSHDVTSCAYIGDIGLGGTTGVSAPGFITVVRANLNPKGVFVDTYDSTGAAAERGFHLVVVC